MKKPTGDSPPQPSTPSIELLGKLELAIETVLTLVPQIVRICVQYAFRPNRFLDSALSIKKPYNTPPYTFLAFTALALTLVAFISFAAYESMVQDILSALSVIWGGSRDNEGDLRLARLVQAVRDRSLTSIFLSTGAVVVALAALAKALARVTPPPSSSKQLERLLCYVAGGQQLHTGLMLPVLVILYLLCTFSPSPLAIFALALPTAWCLLLPAITISRAIGRLGSPARSMMLRIGWGMLFSMLNVGIVVLAVYSIEAVPTALARLQTRLEPSKDRIEYAILEATASIDEYKQVLLTVVIEMEAGRPLVIEKNSLMVGTHSFPERDWRQSADLVNSTDGPVPVVVIRRGETKWIQVRFLLDGDGSRMLLSGDGKLSGYVSGGATNIKFTDVDVTGKKRLQGADAPNQLK